MGPGGGGGGEWLEGPWLLYLLHSIIVIITY